MLTVSNDITNKSPSYQQGFVGINLYNQKLEARLKQLKNAVRNAINSVYTSGIDNLISAKPTLDNGFQGKFLANNQVYNYKITGDGDISYVESSASQISLDSSIKKKTCERGKPCGDSCIARGIKCRLKLSGKGLSRLKVAQKLVFTDIERLTPSSIKNLNNQQKIALGITAGIVTVAGAALLVRQYSQFGDSIYPKTERFDKTPQPGRCVNGLELKSEPEVDYSKIPDNKNFYEPPYPGNVSGANRKAGVTVIEPDGRIWLMESAGAYGGEFHGNPRGGAEPGLTDQQNAIKEAREELGLKVKIIDYLGDFDHYTGQPVKAGDNPAAVTRQYIAVREGGAPWDAHYESSAVKLATLDDANWMTMFNSKRDQPAIVEATKRYVRDPNKWNVVETANRALRVGRSRYNSIQDFQKHLCRYNSRQEAIVAELGIDPENAKKYEGALHRWQDFNCQKIITAVDKGIIKEPPDLDKYLDEVKISKLHLTSNGMGNNSLEIINQTKQDIGNLNHFMATAPKYDANKPLYRGMAFKTDAEKESFVNALQNGMHPDRWMSWGDNAPQVELYMDTGFVGNKKVRWELEKSPDSVIFSPWGNWSWHSLSKAAGKVYIMPDMTTVNDWSFNKIYRNLVARPPYTELLNQKTAKYRFKGRYQEPGKDYETLYTEQY